MAWRHPIQFGENKMNKIEWYFAIVAAKEFKKLLEEG